MTKVIFFDMFFKKVENIYKELYFWRERFGKMEIEMDSVNELKKLLSCWDEESLTEKLKKYPYLFDKSQKTYKERDNF